MSGAWGYGAVHTAETVTGPLHSTRWQAWFYDTTWHILGGQEFELYTDQGMNYLRLPDAYPGGLGTVNPLLPGRSVSYYAPSGVADGFLGSVVVEAMGQYDAIRAVSNLRSSKTSTTIDYSLGFGGYPR